MDPASPQRAPVAVLANPVAGNGRVGRQLAGVLDRLRSAGLTADLIPATSRAEADAGCRRAVDDGGGAIVAVGGDGTAHVAIQAAAGRDVPLGLVPLGTGNDLAASLGVPPDPLEAADAVAKALIAGEAARFDAAQVATADGNVLGWFAAILSAGFDAEVAERANRMRWPSGPRRYDVAIFLELLRLAPKRFLVDVDGESWEGPATLVAIGNTARYGGGMLMCPDADPTDGLLDVVVVGPVTRVNLVRLKPRLYQGSHVRHPRVTTMRGRTVRLAPAPVTGDTESAETAQTTGGVAEHARAGMLAFGDGEPMGTLPLTITSVPGALCVAGAVTSGVPRRFA